MGHIINWPRGNLGVSTPFGLRQAGGTTYAEIIVVNINLLMAEADMELGCFMGAATLADKR